MQKRISERKIIKKLPSRREPTWRPSPWNKEGIPDEEKPAPIMMCKRCKHNK